MNESLRNNRATGTATAGPTREQDNDEIDILAVLNTVWRGKWIIGFCAAVGVLLGGYQAYVRSVPMFRAHTVLAAEERTEQFSPIESMVTGLAISDYGGTQTEIEILRSRKLGHMLVDKLDLMNAPEFGAPTEDEVDNPTFSLKATIRSGLKAIFGVEETAPEAPLSDDAIRENVVSAVLGAYTIENIEYTLVFNIEAVSESPQMAALLADSLAEVYIEDQLERKFAASEHALVWLSDRVADLRSDLEASEGAAKNFNASIDLVSIETLEGMNRQLKEMRDRADAKLREKQRALEQLSALERAVEGGEREKILAIANDALLTRAAQNVDEGRATEASFDARVEQVVIRSRLEAARLEEQHRALDRSATELAASVEQQSADLVTLQQLEREVEANRLLYESFLVRLREIAIQQGIEQADARVISQAVAPRAPFKPRRSMILFLGLAAGSFVGILIVLLRELMHRGFRTARDLETTTGYSVLGQIPLMSQRRRSRLIEFIVSNPTSTSAEATRNLRTSIELSNLDNPPKIIMLTSCAPGEGKTTTSITLAHHYAALGGKVLLLEGDIRRRVLNQYFTLKDDKGFVSVLSGEAELKDVILRDERLGIDVMPGENASVSAADLFASAKFGELLKELRNTYDQIIIDTPPVLVVPDARSIALHSDAVIMAVKWDSTPASVVQQGIAAVSSGNTKLTGLILTHVNPKGMRRYGYGTDYGAYGYAKSGYYQTS
ncbi:polysaccharide biosynthesis tyrosine autokinase [Aliiruegeria sabulilitoris]|uniref:polysaccharide biosynthesis tyrosine autokinase n=1 Tax=Aliiruegeria sabulilitoris TaxID=1510458 RepID=UPI0009EC88D6|nr:polysaccharide biosynthesis tyrosine autokinase [Aliiruegeria sabulilitoris]NDR58519.1 polysaccharide biosynthesis tyrosine autokinase [Pseudoruegeria sp. M32A2M]